jgi:hypothetical protein
MTSAVNPTIAKRVMIQLILVAKKPLHNVKKKNHTITKANTRKKYRPSSALPISSSRSAKYANDVIYASKLVVVVLISLTPKLKL